MNAKLRSRLARLEAQVRFAPSNTVRYGWVEVLPSDYTGDRHLVIVKREPTRSPNFEWCHFEERPGPAPKGEPACD